MIETTHVITLLWFHFLADFLLQNDWMATNKSRSWIALAVLSCVYTAVLGLFGGLLWGIANGILHAVADAGSSRATSHLHLIGARHWFFVVIGLDQAAHLTCLILTWAIAVPGF
ncbi:hypothetical protein LCGC14_0895520 [marine sediment metagenome]|uniref:DUF3307 domain-containing protein n=1 Tax=marine sediment metagenome TaxID=412755 RepID=A0A0F9P2U5_9ZZZZ